MSIKPIDNLIQYLRGDKPYGKAQAVKLFEILKTLSDEILELNNSINIINSTVEVPLGLIDGSNTKFTLMGKPYNDFILGFKNGLLLLKNTDFVVKDNLVIMTIAPTIGSVLQFVYSKKE